MFLKIASTGKGTETPFTTFSARQIPSSLPQIWPPMRSRNFGPEAPPSSQSSKAPMAVRKFNGLALFLLVTGLTLNRQKNTQQSCCVRFLQVETSGEICKETLLFCCHAKSHVSVGYGAKGHGFRFFDM